MFAFASNAALKKWLTRRTIAQHGAIQRLLLPPPLLALYAVDGIWHADLGSMSAKVEETGPDLASIEDGGRDVGFSWDNFDETDPGVCEPDYPSSDDDWGF